MNTQKSRDMHRRVLLVDDEEGVRHSWDRYLSHAGFEVDTAEDGAKAIRRLRAEPVDVVISDLKMPGADGVELLQWLHERQPDTRFILLTGYGNEEVERKVRDLGAFDYLEKPVSPETLSMVVTAALLRDEATEEAPEPEVQEAKAAPAPGPMEVSAAVAEAPAEQVETPLMEVVVPTPAVEENAASRSGLRTTLEVAGWLVAAPILGLAFVVFLPVIGFGAVLWTLAEVLLRKNRPART